MKYLILALMLVGLVGCGPEGNLEHRQDQLAELCSYEHMIICGDTFDIGNDKNVTFLQGFTYDASDPEHYTFGNSGECADFALSFLEANLRSGFANKGNARWISGDLDGGPHAYIIIDDTLYDINYQTVVPLEQAYRDHEYKASFLIWP